MSPRLLLLFSIFCLFLSSASVYKTPLCAPGRLEIGGVEAVERNRGRLLLTVRCGLQCHDCHKHLKEFSLMAESISDLSIAILVPQQEYPSAVHFSQLEFPRLQFLHDSAGRTADWPEGQQLLFDRCGRLSKIIQVRAGEPPYHQALEAVRTAVSHAQCGWCQYDTRATRDLSRRQFDAYLSEKRNSQERRDDGYQQRADYQQLRQSEVARSQPQRREDARQQPTYNYEQQRTAQNNQQQRSFSYQSQGQPSYQQGQQRQRQQATYQQSYQHQQQSGQYSQQQQGQQNLPYPQQPQQGQYPQQYSQYSDQRGYSVQSPAPSRAYDQPADYRHQYQPDTNSRDQKRENYEHTTSTIAPKSVKKLHYSEDGDYEDYDEQMVETTARTETQIPRPPSPNPWWPTAPPTTMDYRLDAELTSILWNRR